VRIRSGKHTLACKIKTDLPMEILTLKNIKAGYSKREVLQGISLSVNRGEIISIIGPNGSGKSTVLKIIAGLLSPWDGEVIFNGEVINSVPPYVRAKKGIGYFLQGGEVFESLTVKENLEISGLDRSGYEFIFDVFPDLKANIDRPAGLLSGGQRHILALAMVLIRKPDLLLLDEPSAGLSPKFARDVLNKVKDLQKLLKVSIILVEQRVREALFISDRTLVLVDGFVVDEIKDGRAFDLKEVYKFFFGSYQQNKT